MGDLSVGGVDDVETQLVDLTGVTLRELLLRDPGLLDEPPRPPALDDVLRRLVTAESDVSAFTSSI